MDQIRSLIIISALAIVSALPASAQKKELPPAGGAPKDFRLPPKEQFQLPNGLKVVMIEYGIIPKVNVSLAVGTGRIFEAANENGLFELTTRLLKEGTESKSAKEVAASFARMGGQLSIGAGNHISNISTNALSEFGPESVRLIAEVVLHPAFPEGAVSRLKNDLKREFSVQRSQPQVQAEEAFYQKIYGDHPYGRGLPSDQVINGFNLQQVRSFYNKTFGAGRSTLYVVGKFDKKAVRAAIEESFKSWKKGVPAEYPVAKPAKTNEIVLLDRPGSPQATIFFGLPVPDPSSPDYTALDVMDDLLGGSFGSRITSNIREDKGYTYSPFSNVTTNLYKNALWFEQADVTIEQTGNSMVEIVKEINRIRQEAPSAEELDGIKRYKAGEFVFQNSSPGGIIGQLIQMDLHGLDDRYLNERIKNIYAVTPEQVQNMAGKYLDPDKMVLVVVGDKKQTAPQIEAFKKADKSFKKMLD